MRRVSLDCDYIRYQVHISTNFNLFRHVLTTQRMQFCLWTNQTQRPCVKVAEVGKTECHHTAWLFFRTWSQLTACQIHEDHFPHVFLRQLLHMPTVSLKDCCNGAYKPYTPAVRMEIAKDACQHGVAAASRKFSRQLNMKVSETTVRSICDAYKRELQKGGWTMTKCQFSHLWTKEKEFTWTRLGWKGAIVHKKDTGEWGIRINMHCSGSSTCYCFDCCIFVTEFGGPITLNRSWSRSLLKRMKFVQRRATTARSKFSDKNFAEVKHTVLQDVVTVVTMEEVPSKLVLNWDQTGIKLVPASSWTMERPGAQRVEMIGMISGKWRQ